MVTNVRFWCLYYGLTAIVAFLIAFLLGSLLGVIRTFTQ